MYATEWDLEEYKIYLFYEFTTAFASAHWRGVALKKKENGNWKGWWKKQSGKFQNISINFHFKVYLKVLVHFYKTALVENIFPVKTRLIQ